MSRTCETCKHKGKGHPFCTDCKKDDERPFWKRIPEPDVFVIDEHDLFFPNDRSGNA